MKKSDDPEVIHIKHKNAIFVVKVKPDDTTKRSVRGGYGHAVRIESQLTAI